MTCSQKETHALPTPASRQDRHTAGARTTAPVGEDEAPPSASRPQRETQNGTRRGHAQRGASEGPGIGLRDLLRGLLAGDLESVLLTVAMAAEENRMPSADPDEAERILAFLARLAEYDAVLPPHADGVGAVGTDGPLGAG